jgi:hypothetical protein
MQALCQVDAPESVVKMGIYKSFFEAFLSNSYTIRFFSAFCPLPIKRSQALSAESP